MKRVLDWLMSQRYRPVLLAMAFSALVPVVSTGVMGLVTARRGPLEALASAAAAIGGVALIEVVTEGGVGVLSAVAAIAMLTGVGLGTLVIWARGLSLSFQATLLFCVVAVLVITLVGPDPEQLFAPLMERLASALRDGGATDSQLQALQGVKPVLLGIVLGVAFAWLVAGLFLTYWWLSLMRSDVAFGPEFRVLKMGRVLGVPALVLISIGLVLDTPLVQNLTPLVLFAFLFQGLAVMHAWAHAKKWHPLLVGLIYLLFVTPLTGVTILGLSVVGLLDNVFNLRSPLRAQA